jgi:hypothetical protein
MLLSYPNGENMDTDQKDEGEYEPLDNILDPDLDDAYDVAPTKGGKPINNRMGTLNRVQGMLNRHRNAGRIK